MTRVSVVVDNYNYADYLAAAVDSALAQDHDDVEVVVVDDGSTDDSAAIVRRYGSAVVPVLKDNGGQGSGFAAGVEASSGDVVVILDADDLLHTGAARNAAAALAADPAAVQVRWPLDVVDTAGAHLGMRLPRGEVLGGDLSRRTLREGPLVSDEYASPTSGNAWRRDFLTQVLPMPAEPFRVCADEWLIGLAPAYGSVVALSDVLGCYRAHGRNQGFERPLGDALIDAHLERRRLVTAALRAALERRGEALPAEPWPLYGEGAWLADVRDARRLLRSVLPEDAVLGLLDEGALGRDPVPGRRVVPFPADERGEYAGRPADGAAALRALEATAAAGVTHLAVWRDAAWWLDTYGPLGDALGGARIPVVSGPVEVFDLRGRSGEEGRAWVTP